MLISGTKTREQEFFALDIYGDESNLLHEDGTFNFKCDGRVLRKNETEVNKTVKLSKDDITIQFECGDGSDFSFYYLICKYFSCFIKEERNYRCVL